MGALLVRARLAESRARYAPPHERSCAQAAWKKTPENTRGPREARSRAGPARAADVSGRGPVRPPGAPPPPRPVVANGYEWEFVYVYGAVSPCDGELDRMIRPKMNTVRMGEYLARVQQAHADEFIVMVADGASSHVSKELVVPRNIRLLRLPPYAPELNPQERVWDEIREK